MAFHCGSRKCSKSGWVKFMAKARKAAPKRKGGRRTRRSVKSPEIRGRRKVCFKAHGKRVCFKAKVGKRR